MTDYNQEKQSISIDDLCKRMFKKMPDAIDPDDIESLKADFDQMEEASWDLFIESLRNGSEGVFSSWEEITKKCSEGRKLLNAPDLSSQGFEEARRLYQEALELWNTIDH